MDLEAGYEYAIELTTPDSVDLEHQATQLKLLGVYDPEGEFIDGTASPGSGKRVTVTFRPEDSGRYYIAVGSTGLDRTGLFSILVTPKSIE